MNETTEQPICPHVITSREGTSYCRLAESSVAALTKERDELLAKLFDVRVQRDLLLVDANRLDACLNHTAGLGIFLADGKTVPTVRRTRAEIDAVLLGEVAESMRQSPVD